MDKPLKDGPADHEMSDSRKNSGKVSVIKLLKTVLPSAYFVTLKLPNGDIFVMYEIWLVWHLDSPVLQDYVGLGHACVTLLLFPGYVTH